MSSSVMVSGLDFEFSLSEDSGNQPASEFIKKIMNKMIIVKILQFIKNSVMSIGSRSEIILHNKTLMNHHLT